MSTLPSAPCSTSSCGSCGRWLPLLAAEPLDGFFGDGGEEIDEVAVGIAEQRGAIPPGHRCGLLYPLAHEGLEPLVFFVHIIDLELDDHRVVVRRAGRVIEQLCRLGSAESDGARRQAQLSEDRRGPDCRDPGDLFVELDHPLGMVGDHADGGEFHEVAPPSRVVYLRYDIV